MKKIKKGLSVIGQNIFPLLIIGGIGIYIFGADRSFVVYDASSSKGLVENISQSRTYDKKNIHYKGVSNFSGAPMGKMSRGIMPAPTVFADMRLAPDEIDRKVIKNANLSLEVVDTDEARALAEVEIKSLNGFITNMNSYEVRNGVLAYNLTVRVPSEELDIVIENLTRLGEKKSESFSSNDITAQYTDTEAQIKNLKTRRTRLRKLLEFETKNLADVLQVDRELNNLQNQLDRLTRTQKGRDEKVAYSTLNLNLNPETQIGDITSPNWNPEKSWKKSVNELIEKSQHIIDRLIRLVVLAPIWLPVLFILWILKRKFWKK